MLFTREKVLAAARFTTGLDDFGTDDFIEPLDLLIEDYHNSAKLNRKGVIGSWVYLHRMLSNRLRLTRYLKTTAANEQEIREPVFILGLPRTGSTLLHELLASHPGLRAPRFWETSFVPGYSLFDRFRQGVTSAQIGVVDMLAPGFRSVHSLGTFKPHECITMQALSLRTMQFHAAHNLQKYNQWLETCDWEPAYDCHENFLKWLQFGDLRSRRWVLKAPGHLLSLPNLVNRYPDARFIHLHRDPCEVIPSMASLFLHIRKPFARELDLHEIGRDVTRQWQRGLQASMEYRKTHAASESRFLDIDYRELVADPLRTSEKILGFAGIELDEKTRGMLKEYVESNPKGKHGAHRYSLEQFGLDRETLSELFRDYNSHYVTNQ